MRLIVFRKGLLYISVLAWGVLLLKLAGSGNESEKMKIDILAKVTSFKIFRGEYFFCTADGILRYNKHAIFCNQIGKKGQGPGELDRFNNYGFLDNKLWICDFGKIAVFELDGRLDNERKYSLSSPRMLALPNDCIVTINRNVGHSGNHIVWTKDICLYNSKTGLDIVLMTDESRLSPGFDFEGVEPVLQAMYGPRNDKIYVSDPNRGLIYLFNKEGQKLATIDLHLYLDNLKFDSSYKKALFDVLFQDPRFQNQQLAEKLKRTIFFPRVFPLFHSFYLNDEENILIRTYKKAGTKLLYLCLDSGGALKGKLYIEDKTFDITSAEQYVAYEGQTVFQLFPDEEGNYYIESIRMDCK